MADRQAQLTPSNIGGPSGTSGTSSTSIGPSRTAPLLPRLSMPDFAGEFAEWETFRDQFKSVVIDNTELSDIARMHYLLSCLKGDASDLIKALPLTEANFKVAWKILLQRYDNHRRLVHEHIHVLNTLSIVNYESSSELATLRDKASMAIQALRNLGRPIDHCDDFLVYLVSQRLDKSTRKAWELHLGNTVENTKYDNLNEFLEARIRALESITPVAVSKRTKGIKSVVQSHATNTLKCPVCQRSHVLSSCNDFKTKTICQRRKLVNQLRRCFNCLSGKHMRNECPSQSSCCMCQRRHHTLLHEDSKPSLLETKIQSVSELK